MVDGENGIDGSYDNKTDADVAYAMENRVGYFVVDNREELDAIQFFAGERGIKQKILLRLTPGIDPHTYEAVATGRVDSKFGSAIETGRATLIALSSIMATKITASVTAHRVSCLVLLSFILFSHIVHDGYDCK